MTTMILKLLSSFITKELLISLFKGVILEFVMDLLKEFVESTENPYDDMLIEKFEVFLDERE